MMDFQAVSMNMQMLRKMSKIMDLANARRFREYAEIGSPKVQKKIRHIQQTSNTNACSEIIWLII